MNLPTHFGLVARDRACPGFKWEAAVEGQGRCGASVPLRDPDARPRWAGVQTAGTMRAVFNSRQWFFDAQLHAPLNLSAI